jgi:cytidyltransferase-like protein
MTKALVFGTFDGLHKGHESFLDQAKALGAEVVVGVARDAHVIVLKNKVPRFPEQQRLSSVLGYPGVYDARLCDVELGSFEIIDSVRPDIILIGHDQDCLFNALQSWLLKNNRNVKLVRARKYDAN